MSILNIGFQKSTAIRKILKSLLVLACILLRTTLFAQATAPSAAPDTTISLITCSPGMLVYERFGHTAIRVVDSQNDIDIVFNFGLFDFNQKDFYLRFVKGETDYQLGMNYTHRFMKEYVGRNSSVWEQVLDLTPAQKYNLLEALQKHALPENREYRYNFIFDNCSTRARDMIEASLGDTLLLASDTNQYTFRQWVRRYVGGDTWAMLGIDLVFGLPADKMASQREAMFLPEVLMSNYNHATLAGSQQSLVSKHITLNEAHPSSIKPTNSDGTLLYLTLLLVVIVILTVIEWKRKCRFKFIDTLLLLVYGTIGCIIFFLMFFSVHPMVQLNANLLWMHPLHLPALALLWTPKLAGWWRTYCRINIVLCLLVLLVYALGLQGTNPACVPLVLIVLIRYALSFQKIK